MFIFLLLHIFLITSYGQISTFPYTQNFEDFDNSTGSEIEFIPNWTGNEVRSSSRIFRSNRLSVSGDYALAVQPISTFNGDVRIWLNLEGIENPMCAFYATSTNNGSGDRPVLLWISTSIDGGSTFIHSWQIGDDSTFPNVASIQFSRFQYRLPLEAAGQQNVVLKFDILYGAGSGTAALLLIDDVSVYEASQELLIDAVQILSANQLLVEFNQHIENESAEAPEHYDVNPGIGSPLSAERKADNPSVTILTFSQPFDPGDYVLKVTGVRALEGGLVAANAFFAFSYAREARHPQYNEVIITEIMANPFPGLGLPEVEYIELLNRSGHSIALDGCKISDGTKTGLFPAVTLLPDEYVVVCAAKDEKLFSVEIKTVGLKSWPVLNNEGDKINLLNNLDEIIFSVDYDKSWYNHDFKSGGGYALEMIDVDRFCGDRLNWAASDDPLGGTPGRPNSVQGSNPDLVGPELISAIALDPTIIKLLFNEKLALERVGEFKVSFDKGLVATAIRRDSFQLDVIIVELSEPLLRDEVYTVEASHVLDCAGNDVVSSAISIKIALPERAVKDDVIINELLFNPRQGGVKFVEVYNNSEKYINLNNWHLGNIVEDTMTNKRAITHQDFVLPPRHFLALTTDPEKLKAAYPLGKEGRFFKIAAFPTFNQSAGTMGIANAENALIDATAYDEGFHALLLKTVKGVSLERVSFDSDSMDPDNWHSASTMGDHATPGVMNSQAIPENGLSQYVNLEPKIFVPGETGTLNGFTRIKFSFPEPGYMGNVMIFNLRGIRIKNIAQNILFGTQGELQWNGTDDKGKLVSMGYYLVFIEVYSVKGKVFTIKDKVAVGKKY